MAVTPQPIREVTVRLSEEITSRDTRLMRLMTRNAQTGFLEPQYPIQITAESNTYELDANDNKLDLYDHRELGTISLTAPEIYALWTELVTLKDGTTHMLGNVLADKIDAILDARYNIPAVPPVIPPDPISNPDPIVPPILP